MKYLFIVLGVLLLLGIILLLSPIGIKLYYNNETDVVSIKLKCFGITFTIYPRKKPKKKKKRKKKKQEETTDKPEDKNKTTLDFRKLYERYGFTGLINIAKSLAKSVWSILSGLLSASTVNRFNLKIIYAGSDAADTAIVCGWAYSVICPVASQILAAAKKYKESQVDILPNYTEGAQPYIEADIYVSITPMSLMLLLVRNAKPYIKLFRALLEAINKDTEETKES
ncbi:MAG: DUF2953 domain-containing protein [Eubacteriales bacterium]|nr:DUF2953 domain-containing protein [Eubacteriales bacterium]